ncbi:hypothetical protein OPT61_g596 [Boeremia exigua]|uniref:Uncharacterized protein n=1 Tax=Boeremia exigua TaxID=749465 RepID=A0ACC2IT61_9PLEO|nr:hypothetical protein OPT61_g596 [Boeremia exigua]
MQLSAADSTALLHSEETRGRLSPHATRFVDNTAQIVQSYDESRRAVPSTADSCEQSLCEPRSASDDLLPFPVGNDTTTIVTAASSALADSSASDISVHYSTATSLHELLPNAYSLRASSQGTNQGVLSSDAGTSHNQQTYPVVVAPSYYDSDLPASMLEQIQLIRAYLVDIGTWCEVTDIHRHFTVVKIHPLMSNKPFVAAAMALASRQHDIIRKTQKDLTLSLYQYAVRSLLYYEPSQCGEATLVCCILLSVYEMFTSDVSEWRRHLKGCMCHLENNDWNGSSPALIGASFWVFARLDMWAAYLNKESTLLPTDGWIRPEDLNSSTMAETAEGYCNLVTLLLARIINLLADRCQQNAGELWDEVQQWYSRRPPQLLPVLRTEPSGRNPFPMILHAGNPSICANIFYHTGCILLLRTGRVQSVEDNRIYDPIWHAKELCGTSVTTMSHACWINHVCPLYVASEAFGNVLEGELEEVHGAEKFAILKHLARIERETGWPTADKASSLRKVWGLG